MFESVERNEEWRNSTRCKCHRYKEEIFMATIAVRRIWIITLAVALCITFMAVSLLLNPLAEGVAPAAETVRGSGGYGEPPPLW